MRCCAGETGKVYTSVVRALASRGLGTRETTPFWTGTVRCWVCLWMRSCPVCWDWYKGTIALSHSRTAWLNFHLACLISNSPSVLEKVYASIICKKCMLLLHWVINHTAWRDFYLMFLISNSPCILELVKYGVILYFTPQRAFDWETSLITLSFGAVTVCLKAAFAFWCTTFFWFRNITTGLQYWQCLLIATRSSQLVHVSDKEKLSDTWSTPYLLFLPTLVSLSTKMSRTSTFLTFVWHYSSFCVWFPGLQQRQRSIDCSTISATRSPQRRGKLPTVVRPRFSSNAAVVSPIQLQQNLSWRRFVCVRLEG